MEVTPSGIVIDAKLLHPLKAPSSMEITHSGGFIDSKYLHSSNTLNPILRIVFGKFIVLIPDL